MPEKEKMASWKKVFIGGCLAPLLIFTMLFAGLAVWFAMKKNPPPTPPDYIQNVEPQVEKKLKKIEEKKKKLSLSKQEPAYDLDQTARALYSIEKALLEAKNFEDLTPLILQKDSDKVPPDVAELKYRFFNIYKKMLESQDELSETNSIYNVASGALLDVLSSVDSMTFSVNRDQAQKVWQKRMAEVNVKNQIRKRISKHREELVDFYFDYLNINSKYMKEWDKLCSVRDRAYLAIYEGDWDAAVKNASAAVKLAPHEKEAHILLAMALLERKGEIDTEHARVLVDDFLKRHQGQEAPAHLLRGVINLKTKDLNSAMLDFDQAATYYPKQQEELLDLLNLYKKRSFLNKSKEGRMIINMYRGIMTGSGYFSPDFQKARIFQANNEKEKARKKVFDHFFRRRLQGQWDKVLTDFRFCNRYLDTELLEISNGQKINLEIDSAFFTNSVIVTANNDSKRDIHNVTLLLCVRFTDMFKGDYVSFPVGETVALLKAGENITVGRQNITDITKDKIGTVKEFKDIIDYAAVLISDEVIAWVEAKAVKKTIASAAPGKNKQDLAKEIVNVVVESLCAQNTPEEEKARRKKIAEGIANVLISSTDKNAAEMTPEEQKAAIENGKKLAKDLMFMAVDTVSESIKNDKTLDKIKYPVDKIKTIVKEVMKQAIDDFSKEAEKK